MQRQSELAIYEVYYDEDGGVAGYSAAPTFPAGETLDELTINCDLFLLALKKPILQYQE